MWQLRAFLSLPPAERRALLVACSVVAAIRLGLWLLPFSALYRMLDRPLLPRAANPVSEVTFTDLSQWCKPKKENSNNGHPDRKREYGKSDANLFSARHAIRRKQ